MNSLNWTVCPLYIVLFNFNPEPSILMVYVTTLSQAGLVCEEVMSGSGEIVACVCPSSKIIVTAGTSSVSHNIIDMLL